MDNSEIVKHLQQYESQSKNLKLDIMKICWFMRGGVTYQESLNMDIEERKIVAKIVKENLETTKKSGRDFF